MDTDYETPYTTQIKTTRYHYTTTQMAYTTKGAIPPVGENVGQLAWLRIVGKSARR